MENQEGISKMDAGVTIYGSLMSEITIYGSLMLKSGKGTEICNWKVLENMQRFLKVLEHFQVGHMSWSLKVRGTEFGHRVSKSLKVWENLGMACNKIMETSRSD